MDNSAIFEAMLINHLLVVPDSVTSPTLFWLTKLITHQHLLSMSSRTTGWSAQFGAGVDIGMDFDEQLHS